MQVERIATAYHLVPLVFQASNVPDSTGNAKAVEPASNEYLMPWRGSIVGLSVRHNADLTGGAITWRPTIGGTANTTLTVLTDDTHQGAYGAVEADRIPFAAGALLGVDWTKSGTVAPTTTDVTITLWVLVENAGL